MSPHEKKPIAVGVNEDAELNEETLEMNNLAPLSQSSPYDDASSDENEHTTNSVGSTPIGFHSPTTELNQRVPDNGPETRQDTEADIDDDKDVRCGFLNIWTPKFLQPLANMKVFVLLYIFQDIFRSMFFSYWTSSISTVEKRYRLPSKWVGSFSAMGEGGKLVCVFLFAHFGGRGHRPRWMSLACLCVGLAAVILCIPETFVPLPTQADLISFKNASTGKTSSKRRAVEEMCLMGNDFALSQRMNQTQCDKLQSVASSSKQWSLNAKIWWAIGFFVLGHTVIDAGSGIPRTIGVPFIYDNVKLSDTPLYYAMVYAGRVVGPLAGYTLGSLISRIYIDPGNAPEGVSQNDPQWIGAWYLGFLGIFVGEMLASFMFLWFPKRVRRANRKAAALGESSLNTDEKVVLNRKTSQSSEEPLQARDGNIKPARTSRYGEKGRQASVIQGKARLKDLPRDLYHLLKNPFILFVVFGRAIDVLGSAGFRHLTPKYLENHFRVTTSKANIFTGISTVLAFTTSGLIGAFLIKRFNFQPRAIATVGFVTQVIVAFGTMSLALFPCDGPLMAGQDNGPNQPFDVQSLCSADCHCQDASFTPICDHITGINYFSPCRAGCTQRMNGALAREILLRDYEIDVGSEEFTEAYTNCSCIDDSHAVLTRGYCSLTGPVGKNSESTSCDGMFYWYTIAKMCMAFVAGLPSVGGIMLMFRLVEPELKSLAAALMSFTATLMGFLPGSFIAGSILDSVCILWNKAGATNSAGCQTGGGGGGLSNCLLYDNRNMRLYFHLFVGILRAFGLVFDAAILWWVWNIKFHVDDNEVTNRLKKNGNNNNTHRSSDRVRQSDSHKRL